MIQITKLTNASKQQLVVIGEDGELVTMNLVYSSTQEAWNISFEYDGITINGMQLTVSPNILHNYKNILPFGIVCTSTDGQEPKYIEDFQDERVELFMVSLAEREQIEVELF